MRKTELILLALAGLLLPKAGYSQQTQAAPATREQQGRAGTLAVGNVPTPNDMYCSGFISNEHISDKLFVAAGHNSPDQSRFAGLSDVIFIHGQGMKPGERYQIIRHAKDPNHYEIYRGQRSAIREAGEPYFELAIVRIADVQKDTGIATFELS